MSARVPSPRTTEEYELPTDPMVRDRWVCDTLGKAAWASKKLAEIREQQAEVVAVAEAEIAKYQEWANEQLEALEPSAGFFEYHLMAYALEQREKTGAKTTTLPHAVVETRTKNPGVKVEDEAATLMWAHSHLPSAIKVKESLSLTELKKLDLVEGVGVVDRVTGEQVPGLAITSTEITAKVKTL